LHHPSCPQGAQLLLLSAGPVSLSSPARIVLAVPIATAGDRSNRRKTGIAADAAQKPRCLGCYLAWWIPTAWMAQNSARMPVLIVCPSGRRWPTGPPSSDTGARSLGASSRAAMVLRR
jgi:hypothetical protein